MRTRGGRLAAVLVLAAASAVTSVAAVAAPVPAGSQTGRVIRVPADEPTIQAAVDASKPGTLILVSPGVYREAVVVDRSHENIVVRGVDRATTIVDGEQSQERGHNNGFEVHADGVAIENITARNFVTNGFYWEGVDGYHGAYLTAIRNGDYGVYAFDSVNGQFDHSYAAGSPDAGFYIGQCFPCNALITDVEAEWNGIGYSGTNAGGNLVIASSSWHDNRVGIAPNSLTSEELSPQRSATIVGNHVVGNVNQSAAGIEIARVAGGTGIVVAGGRRDQVLRNLVTRNTVGIGLIPLPEKLLEPDRPTAKNFDARKNTVRSNVAQGNTYDLVVATSVDDPTDGGGNCFSGNDATTTVPVDLQTKLPCGSPPAGFETDAALLTALFLSEKPESPLYTDVALPDPPPLENMPRARTAPARPATSEPSIRVSVRTITTPTG
jgi:Right handed beta helix region